MINQEQISTAGGFRVAVGDVVSRLHVVRIFNAVGTLIGFSIESACSVLH
jgi:hypothetical protein